MNDKLKRHIFGKGGRKTQEFLGVGSRDTKRQRRGCDSKLRILQNIYRKIIFIKTAAKFILKTRFSIHTNFHVNTERHYRNKDMNV